MHRSRRAPAPQAAGESLAEAQQSSEGAKRASRDLAKGLVRHDVLRHKDKVRGGRLAAAPAARAAPARNSPAPPHILAPACPQEVRLYAALCLCHILRLNAPDTPYSDAELQVRGGGEAGMCLPPLPSGARSVPGA